MNRKKIVLIVYLAVLVFCGGNVLQGFYLAAPIFDFEKMIMAVTILGFLAQGLLLLKFKGKVIFMVTLNSWFAAVIAIVYNSNNAYHYMVHYDVKNNYLMIVLLFLALALLLFFAEKGKREIDLKKDITAMVLTIAVCGLVCVPFMGIFAEDFDVKTAETYYENADTIAVSGTGMVYLKDGKVKTDRLSAETEKEIQRWENVKKVVSGGETFYALTFDGRVLACGDSSKENFDVKNWRKIKDISASEGLVAGINDEGRLFTSGARANPKFSGTYKNASQIEVVADSIAILKTDGSVEVLKGEEDYIKDAKHWKDVMFISGGATHLIGLTKDGMALAEGMGFYGECDVDGMKKIQYAYAGTYDTVLVRSNGKILAVGEQKDGLRELAKQGDFVALADSDEMICSLQKNGLWKSLK